MAMTMNQMQMMMAHMHEQNYINDTSLAQYFQEISNVYTSMAQAEYEMYQMHSGQAQGMQPPTQRQTMPGMGR